MPGFGHRLARARATGLRSAHVDAHVNEQVVHWNPDDAVAPLRQIGQEDAREPRVYEALLRRSDPQSFD